MTTLPVDGRVTKHSSTGTKMASQSAVRKKVSTSLGKLRPPGTPVRMTRSVTRARGVRADSEETEVRCEEMAENRSEQDRGWQDGDCKTPGADNFGARGDGPSVG